MSELTKVDRLGTCDRRQYEHFRPHIQIHDVGQYFPPFGCLNWKPIDSSPVPEGPAQSSETVSPAGGSRREQGAPLATAEKSVEYSPSNTVKLRAPYRDGSYRELLLTPPFVVRPGSIMWTLKDATGVEYWFRSDDGTFDGTGVSGEFTAEEGKQIAAALLEDEKNGRKR